MVLALAHNQVAAVEKSLEDIGKRRKVWLKLHETLQDFEKGLDTAPVLAGLDWSDLRHDLSLRDGDAEGEGGAEGLTSFVDLSAATGREAAPRKAKGLGGGKSLGLKRRRAKAAQPEKPRPLPPAEDLAGFLEQVGLLQKYGADLESEEVTLDLLLDFAPKDFAEFDISYDDAEIISNGIDEHNDRVAAWEKRGGAVTSSSEDEEEGTSSGGSGGSDDSGDDSGAARAPGGGGLGAGAWGAATAEQAALDDGAESDTSSDGEYEGDDFALSSVPNNIELTRYAYQWIQRSDRALVAIALKKINLLAEGPAAWKRSRQLSKVLEGQAFTPTKFPVREAKLDRGMRILWQERGAVYHADTGAPRGAIIIWYIVKHDFISAKLKDIDRCFQRMNGDRVAAEVAADSPSSTGSSAAEESKEAKHLAAGLKANAALDAAFKGGASGLLPLGRHREVPEVLLDPRGNTPLMVYDVMVHELPQLKAKWYPPMRLTAREEKIVTKEGLVTIVGRSGTGKTVCVAMRMDRDAKRAASGDAQQRQFRQVFVARSRALCSQVKRMVESGGHNTAATGRREAEAKKLCERADLAGGGGGGGGATAAIYEETEQPRAQFVTIDQFVALVESHVRWDIKKGEVAPSWNAGTQIRWLEFERDFWASLDKQAQQGFGSSKSGAARKLAAKVSKKDWGSAEADDASPAEPLVPLTVWTQIRSFIKGSVEAAWGCAATELPPPYCGEDPAEKKRHDAEVERIAAESFEARAPGTPMSRAEYLAMDKSRCPLNQKQRAAAYEYYTMYQAWLKSDPEIQKWDDTDRILHLVGKLKSVERGRMTSSIWKDSRVPFDRIYADEVQDATQAEVTLLSLSCNDHVDGLFLAGDNAQAITHGVSFRFEELRLIMKLASGAAEGDRGKETSLRSHKLVHNYRSHSGILEFAASFLTSLDACFPRSYSAMAADHGLSRGPRPGLWACPNGFESLQRALRVDQRLIVLTRDENSKKLETLLAQDEELFRSVNILGICEAKGLEFNDVLLVDFFSSAPKHIQAAWVAFLNEKVLDVDPRAIKEAGEATFVHKASRGLMERVAGKVPLDLEVDLKILYTAVTRCRNRLVLCETTKTAPWSKFSQAYERYGLVVNHTLPETAPEGGGETMMPDELVELGLNFIERVDPSGDDPGQAVRDCMNAVKFFRRAGEGAKPMVERTEAVERFVRAWNEVKRAPFDDPEAREALAVAAAADLVKVGLVSDAVRLCRLANSSDVAVVGPLVWRLLHLGDRWRSVAEARRAPAGPSASSAAAALAAAAADKEDD